MNSESPAAASATSHLNTTTQDTRHKKQDAGRTTGQRQGSKEEDTAKGCSERGRREGGGAGEQDGVMRNDACHSR